MGRTSCVWFLLLHISVLLHVSVVESVSKAHCFAANNRIKAMRSGMAAAKPGMALKSFSFLEDGVEETSKVFLLNPPL